MLCLRSRLVRGGLLRKCVRYHSSKQVSAQIDIDKLLAEPTWSLESLLPSKGTPDPSQTITAIQLHHLLRLSALPPPKDADEEAEMLSTLSSQLHFVQEIQKVDTTGVLPLKSLRDETDAGQKAATIGLQEMREALDKEDLKGDYYKRIRRPREEQPKQNEAETWDVLGQAQKKVGRYFVVKGGQDD